MEVEFLSPSNGAGQAALEDVLAHPEFVHGTPLLIICSAPTTWNPPGPRIKTTAQFVVEHAAAFGGRIAVAAPTALHYGLARMFEAFVSRGGIQCAVFREVGPAREWIAAAWAPFPVEPVTAVPCARDNAAYVISTAC